MGKSGKKVKSDKINALRKQYDAFLEDDKKRKDRNEYILGRLEEMRSSTALIKTGLKDKLNIIERQMPFQKGMEDNAKFFQTRTNIPVECYPKQIEISIIKEITKNYILIPKVQSFLPSNRSYNQSSEIADTDWKSKYNILNELKQNEKESVLEKANNVNIEENIDSTIPATVSENIKEDKIIEDIPLRDNINRNNHELSLIPNSNSVMGNPIKRDPLDIIKDNRQKVEKVVVMDESQKKTIDILKEEEVYPNQLNTPEQEENVDTPLTKNDPNYSSPQKFRNVEEKTSEDYSKQLIRHDKHNIEEIIQPNIQENIIKSNVVPNENTDFEKIHAEDLTNKDNINVAEFSNEDIQEHLENEVNVNDIQQYESNEDHLKDEQNFNIDVNEVKKEQNAILYAENPETNYEYEQNNVDDQTNYSAENENYTNEQYPYYDESQQQQPYPSEIEHEETNEHYDPDYRQQYTENYENVPQYNDQYREQYQADNTYELQREQVVSSEHYGELHSNSENFEPFQPENTVDYQNQQDNAYAFEDQVVENRNYESEQYVNNEQQEYSAELPTEQYVAQEEYIQMHTEQDVTKNMENELDAKDSYVDNQNTVLKDNIVESNAPDNIPVEIESSVKG